MQQEVIGTYQMNRGMMKQLASTIPAERFAEMPSGINPPAWIVGHCCYASDGMLKMLGREKKCPESYTKLFGMGSTPVSELSAYPSAEALLSLYESIGDEVVDAAGKVTAEQLAGENPVEFARDRLPTIGGMVTFMMTMHEAMHVGQLSAWRRASGFAPLF